MTKDVTAMEKTQEQQSTTRVPQDSDELGEQLTN